jgi:hyperosmotically inducible periplasmic protein
MQRSVLALAPLASLALVASLSILPACASSGGGTGGAARATTASVDDASISARVKTALLNDAQLNATKIDISTSNGVVTMTGSVRSQPEQQRAIQLARQVSGVKDVKANLTVSGG